MKDIEIKFEIPQDYINNCIKEVASNIQKEIQEKIDIKINMAAPKCIWDERTNINEEKINQIQKFIEDFKQKYGRRGISRSETILIDGVKSIIEDK